MNRDIKIGLLGFGTVGTGVVRVLRENAYEISRKANTDIKIKTVLVHDINKKRDYM